MTAYYNEYDPFAAATLRELIKDGLIAPGVVDERSIELVQPSDLKGFRQVHLFAGFGVWSLAARLAGWPDDRSFWSASCPCPPFSSAGKVKACPECHGFKPVPHVSRTGFFLCSLCGHAWLADQRHLWPEVWRLIRDARPSCAVGEQVASADGRTWLDLVRASLEILAYDAWGVDTCAAGFGAPHIRPRLYWMADTEDAIGGSGERGAQERIRTDEFGRRGSSIGGAHERLAVPPGAGLEGAAGQGAARSRNKGTASKRIGRPGGLDNALGRGRRKGRDDHGEHERDVSHAIGEIRLYGLADADGEGFAPGGEIRSPRAEHDSKHGGPTRIERPGPTNGLWRDVDWLGCTDGRWRPVEPGSFPLANVGTFRNRVAELRGAGNAINVAQAAGFLRAIGPEIRWP